MTEHKHIYLPNTVLAHSFQPEHGPLHDMYMEQSE